MPIFMDRHDLRGMTAEDVADAHRKDLEIQDRYGVKYMAYWFDEDRGLGLLPRPCARRGHGRAGPSRSAWRDRQRHHSGRSDRGRGVPRPHRRSARVGRGRRAGRRSRAPRGHVHRHRRFDRDDGASRRRRRPRTGAGARRPRPARARGSWRARGQAYRRRHHGLVRRSNERRARRSRHPAALRRLQCARRPRA